MAINNTYPITNIQTTTRTGGSGGIGRFASIGTVAPVTPGVENPWVFSSFMVTVTGNVVVKDRAGNDMLFAACIPGVQYWAVGIEIVSAGTTATGIRVYGGV